MGSFLSKRRVTVLMVGLDGAGKTTILAHMVDAPFLNRNSLHAELFTLPTAPLELVEFSTADARWAVWDMGGQGRYRGMWQVYADQTAAVAFVLDLSDAERIATARDELYQLLDHVGSRRVALLVLANKIDRKGHAEGMLDVESVRVGLGLSSIEQQRGHRVKVQAVSGITGAGLHAAFGWLAENA